MVRRRVAAVKNNKIQRPIRRHIIHCQQQSIHQSINQQTISSVAQNRNESMDNSEVFERDEYSVSEDSSAVRRDYSERDVEQSSECTESSDRSHEMLGHEGVNADRYISASRCIFFTILCVSAVLCAGVAFALYKEEENANFKRSVRA